MTEKEFFENAGKYLSGEGDQKPQEKDFAPLEQVWEQAGTFRYSEEEENDSAWARMQDRMNAAPVLQVSHVRRNVWFAAVAAAVLLLISGGIFVVYKQMNEVELQAAIERSTGTNEIATLTLNDGTVIVMNASTKISVPAGFGTTHRHLSLTGQADFEVARNEKLPFEVKTGSATTRVLGTGFDISAYPGEAVLIQVKHGKVEFGTEQQHVTLLKGNGARLQDGTALSTFDVSGKPGGWKTGPPVRHRPSTAAQIRPQAQVRRERSQQRVHRKFPELCHIGRNSAGDHRRTTGVDHHRVIGPLRYSSLIV